MRVLGSVILIILLIPTLLLGILAGSIRFQLLNSNFWLTTFEKNNIYSRVASEIKKSAEDQVEKEGGSVRDAKVLTDLITQENLKDIISKNLTYSLNYMNAKTPQFNVYIPVSKLPRDLLTANISGKVDTISLETLLSDYNVKGIDKNRIWLLGTVGMWATRLLIVDWVIILMISFSLYFLTVPGKKLLNLGIGFILTGVLLLGAFGFLEVIRGSMITEWPKGNEASQHILGTFLPYILRGITIVWLVIGVLLLLGGIALFFVKKPVYNKRK